MIDSVDIRAGYSSRNSTLNFQREEDEKIFVVVQQ